MEKKKTKRMVFKYTDEYHEVESSYAFYYSDGLDMTTILDFLETFVMQMGFSQKTFREEIMQYAYELEQAEKEKTDALREQMENYD